MPRIEAGERLTIVTRYCILVCTVESVRLKEEHQPGSSEAGAAYQGDDGTPAQLPSATVLHTTEEELIARSG